MFFEEVEYFLGIHVYIHCYFLSHKFWRFTGTLNAIFKFSRL